MLGPNGKGTVAQIADEWDGNSVEETLQSSFASRIERRGLSLFLPFRRGSRWHILEWDELKDTLDKTSGPLALSEEDKKLLIWAHALAVAKEKETGETNCIAMVVRENIRTENVQRAARRRDLFRLVLETAVRLGDSPVSLWIHGPPKESLALIVGRRIDERARKEAERNDVSVDLVHFDQDQDLPPLLRIILRARLFWRMPISVPRWRGGWRDESTRRCRKSGKFAGMNTSCSTAFPTWPSRSIRPRLSRPRQKPKGQARGSPPATCPNSARGAPGRSSTAGKGCREVNWNQDEASCASKVSLGWSWAGRTMSCGDSLGRTIAEGVVLSG